jgi:cytochrome c
MPDGKPRRRAIVIVAIALSIMLARPTLAAGDVATGHRLAAQWCNSCHFGASGGSRSDAAPDLGVIAKQRSPEQLRGWLSDPHPPMPNPSLTRAEIDDLVAYLTTFARR